MHMAHSIAICEHALEVATERIKKRRTDVFDSLFDLFSQQSVHGWDHLYRHINKPFANDETDVILGLGMK
jgi:predicted kinase